MACKIDVYRFCFSMSGHNFEVLFEANVYGRYHIKSSLMARSSLSLQIALPSFDQGW